jgi:hypothetical protein
MGIKVVYNACYCGFGLSKAAIARGIELSGDESWGDHVERHDATMVAVVEELGEAASAWLCNLKIFELTGSIYLIDEYDGFESVIEPDGVEWVVVK